jgi:drug/metabolite transporter (DMT)-like permease
MISKVALIFLSCCAALASQLNLQRVSSHYSTLRITRNMHNWVPLISFLIQMAIPAGLSLAITVYAYTKFKFFELVLAQSFYFILAALAKVLLFKEPFTLRVGLASILILGGITLAMG